MPCGFDQLIFLTVLLHYIFGRWQCMLHNDTYWVNSIIPYLVLLSWTYSFMFRHWKREECRLQHEQAKRRERWGFPLSHCLLKHLVPHGPSLVQIRLSWKLQIQRNLSVIYSFKQSLHNNAKGQNHFLLTPFNLSFSVPLL